MELTSSKLKCFLCISECFSSNCSFFMLDLWSLGAQKRSGTLMLAWLQRKGNSCAFLMSNMFSMTAWKLTEDVLVVVLGFVLFVFVGFFLSSQQINGHGFEMHRICFAEVIEVITKTLSRFSFVWFVFLPLCRVPNSFQNIKQSPFSWLAVLWMFTSWKGWRLDYFIYWKKEYILHQRYQHRISIQLVSNISLD